MNHQDEILDSGIKLDGDSDLNLHVKYAGFWIRVAAALIDTLVLIPIFGLNFYNLFGIKSIYLALLLPVIAAIYKPFMEYKYGATLGKMAVKIKVVDLDYKAIDLGTAIKRYIPWILVNVVSLVTIYLTFSNPAFIDAESFMEVGLLQQENGYDTYVNVANLAVLISVIFVAFDKEKQGLHDRLADTYCIYSR